MLTSNTRSSSSSLSSFARINGPRLRSNPRLASRRPISSASSALRPCSSARRSSRSNSNSVSSPISCQASPSSMTKLVLKTSCRRTISLRLQLVQKPQPLLRIGERQPSPARDSLDLGRRRVARLRSRLLDLPREPSDRRMLEQCPQRQLHLERSAQSRDHLCRQQRVPSSKEEIGLHSQPSSPQHSLKDSQDDLLDRSSRPLIAF